MIAYVDDEETPNHEGPAQPNVYQLAEMAGCLKPDDEDSYGAHWLDEIAFWVSRNPCVPVGDNARFMVTNNMPDWKVWRLYAELGGWQVAVYTQRVTTGADMTAIARRALYHFALKLASAVVQSATTGGAA